MNEIVVNAERRIERAFPGYFPETKHNHYRDFGYPAHLTFEMLHGMYSRNGLAYAGVNKTIMKTWQDMPVIRENDEDETPVEKQIRMHLSRIRFWQSVSDADRKAMVGRYAGLILRFADNQPFSKPVGFVPGGLQGLVEVIPVWEGQLRVASFNTDQTSVDYGKPTLYQFHEVEVIVGEAAKFRSFEVHPDRIIIWSMDGTVHCSSALEPGYNDLMTVEKVIGAGGEGFWKNAKSAPVIEVDKEARLSEMAKAMGVDASKIADAMNSQVEDWQKGFDKLLMLQGMQAKTLGVTLPIPEHFFMIAAQSFASSLSIPFKILVGSQSGERASTEDANEWAQHNEGRRENICLPILYEIVFRLQKFRILPEKDWEVYWKPLTDNSEAEKMDRAMKMAEINAKSSITGELAFLPSEIRAVVGMSPLSSTEASLSEEEDDIDDEADDEEAVAQ